MYLSKCNNKKITESKDFQLKVMLELNKTSEHFQTKIIDCVQLLICKFFSDIHGNKKMWRTLSSSTQMSYKYVLQV